MEENTITVVTFYTPEEEDYDPDEVVGGDYSSVGIYVKGKLKRAYGDYYHDKGREKAEGYIDGFTDVLTSVKVYEFRAILKPFEYEPPATFLESDARTDSD